MESIYAFENALRPIVSKYDSKYRNNKSHLNAVYFNASYEMLMNTMQMGCEVGMKYQKAVSVGSPLNVMFTYVRGEMDAYNEFP